MWTAFVVLLLAYLPGALLFRAPVGERHKRGSLSVEERLFWYILLSLALTSVVALTLAAGGGYTLSRLLWTNGAFSAAVLAVFRGRLRLGGLSRFPTSTAIIPLLLVIGGFWLNFRVPPAEYIIGGRDPGIYMNEGIQIAQHGGLVVSDDVVGSVPPLYLGLFFRQSAQAGYYSNRFMGFFLLDPRIGSVVGQFPHGFPMWVGIAYGVNGLSGARSVPELSALLGLLAVYFAGARLMGRAAGAAGAALLAVNVVQLWYARYPNAEILLQPLVFGGFLAFVRATREDDPFFAPVAALLFVLGAFTHLTGALAVAAVAAAGVLDIVVARGRVRLSFWLPLAAGTGLAGVYLWRFIPPYFNVPLDFVRNLEPSNLAIGAAMVIVAGLLLRVARGVPAARSTRWISTALIALVWLLAAYAFFFRTADARLAPHDAESLRTFTSFYLSPYGLAAALIGFALVATEFADSAVFLVTLAAFSFAFFYKIRIVPEHFWAARRFLAVILPGSLLLVGAAAFCRVRIDAAGKMTVFDSLNLGAARYGAGLVLVLLLGWHFVDATKPVLHHVEYASLIPHLEQLASTFGDDDLVLVESRGASDSHVLALPLAYIYARNVLVFAATDPDKAVFREFLTWALGKYRRVFFMGGGGGGTELLSQSMTVVPIRGERFQMPEYESAWNAYPRGARYKEFDLSVYEFLPKPANIDTIALDVGAADDLYVRRLYAKEQNPYGLTFRWTRDISFVSIVGIRPEHRQLTMWMGTGGRPSAGGLAAVEVSLESRVLGSVIVGDALQPYRFDIPADLAKALAGSENAAQLRIMTRTWNPAKVAGVPDNRDLGVMLDRIEIR